MVKGLHGFALALLDDGARLRAQPGLSAGTHRDHRCIAFRHCGFNL